MKPEDVDGKLVEAFVDKELERRQAEIIAVREQFYDAVTNNDPTASVLIDRLVKEMIVINYLLGEKEMIQMAAEFKAKLVAEAKDLPQA